jgi:lactate dehydrogenase-like 2-hydroxyacid dehydrogenase
MTGKVLGVIGMGRIGQAIAGARISASACRWSTTPRTPRPLPDLPARALPRLTDVMAAADVVVLAVPATPATHHLIDAAALAAMRPQAHLVNISRGDVIDEAALIAALRARRIAGAGLDVYEHEPQVPEALRAMENVVLLPHLGTAALEVREAMGLMVLENARAFRDGRALPNVV